MYAMREALRAFRRAPLLTGLSAGMIALSLFLVGLFGLAAHNVRRALDRVESRVEIVAFLHDDAIPEMVTQAQNQIEEYEEVREVRYISREAALLKARREFPEFQEQFGSLESNPLPASIEVPEEQSSKTIRRRLFRLQKENRVTADCGDELFYYLKKGFFVSCSRFLLAQLGREGGDGELYLCFVAQREEGLHRFNRVALFSLPARA